jgi:hypothetical protein
VVLARKSGETAAIHMKLMGARDAQIVPGDKLQGTLNSFIGNDPSKWQTKIPTYSQVKYRGIYSGVDLVYYGNQQQLEYDFIVAPGADPHAIRFGIGGAESRIDSNGDLVMHTSLGDVHQHKPVIYQEIAGVRHPVEGSFVKLRNNQVGFTVADYDRAQSLVIDPSFGFSTYLGGSGADQGLAIAVDNLGDTYVGGTTASTNFPTNGSYAGPYPTYPAGATTSAFFSVIFFQNNGGTLFISSYYGGNTGTTSVNGIALIAPTGQLVPYIYVAGTTTATDLPTVNPLQASNAGGSDAFVAQLKFPDVIAYSSYLGGSGNETASSITTDSQGNIIVAGYTTSTDFPTSGQNPPYQSVNEGGTDGFITKFNFTFTDVVYSTYLGGAGNDLIHSIANAKSDSLVIVGSTTSTAFGAANTVDESPNATHNPKAFMATLAYAGGTGPGALRIFGGQGISAATSVVYYPGSSSCSPKQPAAVWVTGYTTSASGFPTKNPIQATSAGLTDAFLQEYRQGALVFSTYYGGSGNDAGAGIGVDACGDVTIGGSTNSSNFPVTPATAVQSTPGGGYDGFIANFVPPATGTGAPTVYYSTYLGGSGDDFITGVAVSAKGNATVVGYTNSSNFPTTNSASPVIQATYGGDEDAFVTRISATQ